MLGQAQYSPTIPTERLGPDRSRSAYPSDQRFWIVDARWAQRAVNAARGRGGSLIYVDGLAGPITIGALRDLGLGLPPAENSPTGQRITSRVLIAKTLSDRLEQNAPVPDPSRPRTTTPTSPSSSAAISTDPQVPGVLLDEGAARSPLADALPWVIGGTAALVAVGGFFIWRGRRRVTRNRRRRARGGRR
jgi:hypothetical protein